MKVNDDDEPEISNDANFYDWIASPSEEEFKGDDLPDDNLKARVDDLEEYIKNLITAVSLRNVFSTFQ